MRTYVQYSHVTGTCIHMYIIHLTGTCVHMYSIHMSLVHAYICTAIHPSLPTHLAVPVVANGFARPALDDQLVPVPLQQ